GDVKFIILMLVPVLVANAYQILILHKVTAVDPEHQARIEARRKARREAKEKQAAEKRDKKKNKNNYTLHHDCFLIHIKQIISIKKKLISYLLDQLFFYRYLVD